MIGFFVVIVVPWLRVEAGNRPGGRPPFLSRDKKGGKETRPTACGPCGATCGGVLAGCAVELTARCALRSDNHGESDHEAGVSCGTPATPQAPRRRRSQKGGEAQHGPSLRSAPGPGPSAAMARVAVWFSGFPSGCAEERSGQRIRARDCLSATQWSEFERDPAGREHRRLPAAKRRDAACRVAFSWLTFFWRGKRK